jgi:hypothetical protein
MRAGLGAFLNDHKRHWRTGRQMEGTSATMATWVAPTTTGSQTRAFTVAGVTSSGGRTQQLVKHSRRTCFHVA